MSNLNKQNKIDYMTKNYRPGSPRISKETLLFHFKTTKYSMIKIKLNDFRHFSHRVKNLRFGELDSKLLKNSISVGKKKKKQRSIWHLKLFALYIGLVWSSKFFKNLNHAFFINKQDQSDSLTHTTQKKKKKLHTH